MDKANVESVPLPIIESLANLSKKAELIEKLAALEHEQWAHWTIYFFKEMSPAAILRWKKQCRTPYDKLSEREKESDRKWARKVLAIIDDKNSELNSLTTRDL